jgi:RNA recognition motif-containing protein
MKIIVLGMSSSITEEDLMHLFKPYGQVKACNIVMDNVKNISKGFGFVEMPVDEEGEAAIKALHGKKIKGHKLRVKISTGEKAEPTPPKFGHKRPV